MKALPPSLLFTLCSVLLLPACEGEPGSDEESSTSVASGSETSTSMSESGSESDSESGSCWDAPEICLRLVECISAVAPDQEGVVTEQFGEGGSCWCGTEDEAQDCYETCVTQINAALDAYPTEPACQESVCPIEELDPEQPYGPPIDGACQDWSGQAQVAFEQPLGVAGSVCMPACAGLAEYCPEHPQTSADGTCYIQSGDEKYCALRCWVDSTVLGGTQCPCGARCQPHGPPDGEGNMRGICTFE